MKYNMELLRTGTGDHLEDLTLMKLAYDRIDGLMDRIEMLTSGPGGIMEMKQTIADKEAVTERLRAALLEIFDHECRTSDKSFVACVARGALWSSNVLGEKKDD